MTQRVPFAVGIVGVVLLLAISATAAPAPYGACLECYALERLGLSNEEAKVHLSGASNYKKCPSEGYTRLKERYLGDCGHQQEELRVQVWLLSPSQCCQDNHEELQPWCNGFAVFYRHSAATTQQCRVIQPSPNTNSWRAAYNSQNAVFTNIDIKLRMYGGDGGTRVEATYAKQTYGQFQVRARQPCGDGVVSTFYLRSNEIYPNTAAGSFDEIDFESITYRNKACSMWLNSWQNSQDNVETQYGQSEYRSLLGWPSSRSTASAFATYTIDWQPGYVGWYVDGKPLLRNSAGDRLSNGKSFRVPNKPMRPTLSLWTDASDGFGGWLDMSNGPWEATYNNVRQVVCDRAAPSTPLGPSWMY